MSKQTISIGAVENDGTGDPLRTAFNKANGNFTEVYDLLGGDTLTAGGARTALDVDQAGTAASAVATHEAALDPHTQYLTAAEGNAAYSAIGHNHDETYAPIAQGVTNGNSHDHNGGDGAQIAYSSLSGLPTLGSLAALSTVGTSQIDNDAVTYAKMQNISATQRALGRNTTGAGDTEEVTLSQLLDWIGSAAQGDILYRGAFSWARLGAGTNGHFLQTQGTGANPQWAAASGSGQSFVVGAGMLDSTAVSNSNANMFSKSVTVAAGDVFWFEAMGRVSNGSGATRTYTYGIGLGGLTLDCVASTTLATATIAAFNLWGTISVLSTSSVSWTVFVGPLPASTDNGAAVTTISRQAWRTSGTNITGTQTALAYIRSSGTGTQNFWVHGYTLRRVGAI